MDRLIRIAKEIRIWYQGQSCGKISLMVIHCELSLVHFFPTLLNLGKRLGNKRRNMTHGWYDFKHIWKWRREPSLSLFRYSSGRICCLRFYVMGGEAITLWSFTSALMLVSQWDNTAACWHNRLIEKADRLHILLWQYCQWSHTKLSEDFFNPRLERILH